MQTVSFAGSSYNIPNTRGDRPWSGLSDFVIAAASKAINTAGGNFTLLADINFGATFGLVSTYYKSRTANVASAGQIRLANADTIKFRNTLNNGDLSVAISSNRLTFEGSRLVIAGAAEIVNADISASAAIAYSKLNLATSIVNADISASAAIAYSKLNLATSIVNADINASAAIAYSKLNLTGLIVNADVGAAAAIALSKLAAVTASRALVSDGSGFVAAHASTTATEIGYVNGVTSAIQTQMNLKAPSASPTFTGTVTVPNGAAATSAAAFGQLKIIQVVQYSSTTGFSTTSSTFQTTDVTGAITPTSASNKILVISAGLLGSHASTYALGSLFRGSTNLAGGSNAMFIQSVAGGAYVTGSMSVLDSPATTSSTTYSVKICNGNNVNAVNWGNSSQGTLILIEVAP